MIEIISYLRDKNINFKTSGSNVSSGWVEIQCPWCDDPSTHLGINPEGSAFHCWRCNKSGEVIKLIKEIEKISYEQAKQTLREYQRFEENPSETIWHANKGVEITIPKPLKRVEDGFHPKLLMEYFLTRGFNPASLIKEKEIYFPETHIGDWKYRFVTPIYMNHQKVCLIGRDVTGKLKPPYRNLHNEESIIPIHETLYGYDETNPGDVIVVVEGLIDQWKLGRGSVATFGMGWTHTQVNLLKQKKPNKVYVLYDSEKEAIKQAKRLASHIHFCEVEVIRLEGKKDPGELSLREASEISRQLLN